MTTATLSPIAQLNEDLRWSRKEFTELDFDTVFIEFNIDELLQKLRSGAIGQDYYNVLNTYWESRIRKSRMTIRELQHTLIDHPGLGKTELIQMMLDGEVISIAENQPTEKDIQVLKCTEVGKRYCLAAVEPMSSLIKYQEITVTNVELIEYAQYPSAVRLTYKRKKARKEETLFLHHDSNHSSRALLVPGWGHELSKTIENPSEDYGTHKVTRMNNLHHTSFTPLADAHRNKAAWVYQ